MKTLINLVCNKYIVPIVVVLSLITAGVAYARQKPPTPQEKAARELPGVLQSIEQTQEAADTNSSAKARRDNLLACINHGDCGPLTQGEQPAL